MASRDNVDVDTFHKSIQNALEKLEKSKYGFKRTAVSNFKSNTRALRTSLLIIPELRVLVLTKRHVGSGNEIESEVCRKKCSDPDTYFWSKKKWSGKKQRVHSIRCMSNRLVKKKKRRKYYAKATSAETRFLPSPGTFCHQRCCLIYFFYVTATLRLLMLVARGGGNLILKRPGVLVVCVRG